MKNLTTILILSLLLCSGLLSAQEGETEEVKTFFLKKIDLIIGGRIHLNSTDQSTLSDFITNGLNSDFSSVTSLQYQGVKDSRDVNLYMGINLSKSFMIGMEYRKIDAESVYTIDYGTPASPFTYDYDRVADMQTIGIIARYNIAFSEKVSFSLQPFASTNKLKSIYSTGYTSGTNSSSTIYDQRFIFNRFGLNSQLSFHLSKRFNFIVNFGRLSYIVGEVNQTTVSQVDGIQQGIPIYSKNDINDFEASFNYSTLSIGFEIVL